MFSKQVLYRRFTHLDSKHEIAVAHCCTQTKTDLPQIYVTGIHVLGILVTTPHWRRFCAKRQHRSGCSAVTRRLLRCVHLLSFSPSVFAAPLCVRALAAFSLFAAGSGSLVPSQFWNPARTNRPPTSWHASSQRHPTTDSSFRRSSSITHAA